jgi:hypothetical protein
MKRNLLSLLFAVALLQTLSGQPGGEGVFSFLQLTSSAKTAALGGIQVALPDADPDLVLQNPALLSPGMNNKISINYAKYLAGIGFGCGAYARDLGKFGMAAIGIQFMDYGQFVAADENGLITGSFGAADYAMNLSFAKSIGTSFTVGASLKPIYSHLENYHAFGIAADLGMVRNTADHLSSFALCFKNIGSQITTYYDNGSYEKIAWSLQLGYTKKLQFAPLRFSMTAYDLNHWNPAVTTTDPNGIDSQSSGRSPFSSVMRHLSLGAEIFPENKVTFRIGYNYRRHEDLFVAGQSGFVGFTTGLGINLAAFCFNYALSGYYQGSLVQNFSLTADLAGLIK